MKKTVLGILFFFLAINTISSQCRPVFTEMQQQLPNPQGRFNYDISTHNNQYSKKYCDLHLLKSYGMNQDSQFLTCQYYDGNKWIILKEVFVQGWIYEMIYWGDRILLHGRFYGRVDQIKLNRMYNLLEYKNGHWDTLPGSWDNSPYHRVFGTVGKDLYAAYTIEDSASRQYWTIRKYDTLKKAFIPVASIRQKYTFPLFRSGTNKMIMQGIDQLNGKPVKGYVYIENDSIYVHNDSRLDDSMAYFIDPTNDHVYAMKNTYEYSVLEYSNTGTFISKRVTTGAVSSGMGPHFTVYGIYNGKILMDDWSLNGNRYFSILCANEVKWKTIRPPHAMNSIDGWTLPMVTGNGIFVYDQDTRHVMRLEEGSRIYGTVFIDRDTNCIFDPANELRLPGQQVKTLSGKFLGVEQADANGNYEVFVPAGNYKLSGPAASPACMTSITIPDGVDIRKNVAVKPLLQSDIKISGAGASRVRWTSELAFAVVIENIGRPLDSAHFEIKMDPRVKIISADAPTSFLSGNTAKGIIRNIGYFDKHVIHFKAIIDTVRARPDSMLCHQFTAYPFDSDKDSTNNYSRQCHLVVYSFDPNHKSCNTDSIMPARRELLEYTIEFQNEGLDDAYDVQLSDRLDSLLDLESFQVLGCSHPYSNICINDHLLTITFRDIHLRPKSVSEDSSKGYLKFSIATRADLRKDQEITNTAQIYFDLNQAVTTNTVNTTVVEDKPTGIKIVKDIRSVSLSVYPNPAYHAVQIVGENIDNYAIYDSRGLQVMHGALVERKAIIDLSSWAPGIYFVRSSGTWCKIIKLAE